MRLRRQPQYPAYVDAVWRNRLFPVPNKSAASIIVPGGRDMVFPDTNYVPALFGVTPTRTISVPGVVTSWAGDAHYEIPFAALTYELTMLVVVGSFSAGTASSICGCRNNNSGSWCSQVLVNASGFYEVYEDATLKATSTFAAAAGDVLVVVRSAVGTITSLYTRRETVVTAAFGSTPTSNARVGRSNIAATGTKSIALFAAFATALDTTAVRSLLANPWQIFSTPTRTYFASGAAADPTGTFASTLANAVMAASGQCTNPGAFATTLAGATMAASGSVGNIPSGSFASALDSAVMAAAGTITAVGAFSSTLAGCTMAASGVAQANPTGTLASTLAGATMNAAGYVGTPPAGSGAAHTRRRLRPVVRPAL